MRVGDTLITPIILFFAVASLPVTAICYFYSRIKGCILSSAVFYSANIYISYAILGEDHIYAFIAIVLLTCVIPTVLLSLFALDVKYAIFCLDTSFFVLLTWALAPFILPVNIILLAAARVFR